MTDFLFTFNPLSVLLWIIILVLLLLYLLGRYYFFVKIGIDGWKGLVPVYSEYLYYKKGRVTPWLSTLFIGLYLFLYVFGEYFIATKELSGIVLFFKAAVIIITLIITWNVNYYISKKFKKGYFFTFLLTFFPYITVPFIGLYKKMRWSYLIKVHGDFLSDDFYSNKKVTVNEICISNILFSLAIIVVFYICIYVIITLFSVEKTLEIIWNPIYISIIIIFIVIVVFCGTLFNYFINKHILNRRK